jgi:hypothetical protein
MRPTFCILLFLLFVFASCVRVKIFPEKQAVNSDLNLKNQKILIVTHDTELSQEYLIYLKNYLRLGLENEKIDAHGINVRYSTPIKPRSIRSAPYIFFGNRVSISKIQDKIRAKKIQTSSQVVFEEDLKTLAYSTNSIQPDLILTIDVVHEHRRVYFTLDNSYQELSGASFLVDLKSAKTLKVYAQNEIVINYLAKSDMLITAKKTATQLIKQYKKDLIIK